MIKKLILILLSINLKLINSIFFWIYRIFIDNFKFYSNHSVDNPFISKHSFSFEPKKNIKNFSKKPILIIDIGTKFGNSAFKISDFLNKKKKLFKIITIDPYETTFNLGFPYFANNLYIKKVFLHNLSLKKYSKNIFLFQKKSREVLTKLIKEKVKVDYIFIDGSHFYKDVMSDLRLSYILKNINKNKTRIFIDDLEYTYDFLDKNINNFNKKLMKILKKDYVGMKAKSKKNKGGGRAIYYFHPGVTYSVKKLNLKVSMTKNGSLSELL
jgi:hypothetical protein